MNDKQPMTASQTEPVHSDDQHSLVSFLNTPLKELIPFNFETLAFVLILVLAILSRFYDLESRVMSHDENTHVYFSYLFSEGGNYIHDPLSHGPFQFHVVAFSYLLFGDNDFTARIPAALFGIAAIVFLWRYRRYIGNKGALASMLLYLISPFMLFYSRYVRNEAFVMLFGVMTVWAMLRYLESGKNKYLYMLSAVTSLHIATKETGYIYTAQILIFLGFYFIYRMNRFNWVSEIWKKRFNLSLLLTAGGLMVSGIVHSLLPEVDATGEAVSQIPFYAVVGLSALFFLGALISLAFGYPLKELRKERTTSILLLLFTLVLPQLSAFPIFQLGWDTTHYDSWQQISHILIFLIPFLLVAVGMGLWWNWKEWLINNAIFYSIFIVFFTSLFTNSKGILSGFVGSLGYWLEQQAVARGGQPWYYYLFLQIPFYEFLGLIGGILAIVLFVRWQRKNNTDIHYYADNNTGTLNKVTMESLTVVFLIYWTVSSYVAYTVAGEKMPWLSVHISIPLLILTGWFIGKLIEKIDWEGYKSKNGVLAILLLMAGGIVFAYNGYLLLNAMPTPAGREWQIALIALFATILMVWIGLYMIQEWPRRQKLYLILFLGLVGLGFVTVRSSVIASYYKYDSAEEYLVYAHSGPGVKTAMDQIEEISRRVAGGKDLMVAYDNHSLYPYWWYLRDYPNQHYFADNPTKDILDAPVILVGIDNYGKVEPILRNAYDKYEYVRVWWPNQDYWTLSFLTGFLKDETTRWDFLASVVDIWLNRDYEAYGLVTGRDMSTENWNPSQKFSIYVRKDVDSLIWDHGSDTTFNEDLFEDSYDEHMVTLQELSVIFLNDDAIGSLNAPRDIALTDDGTFYVADSRNHRVIKFSVDGEFLGVIGGSSIGLDDKNGLFNEPWGLTVAPDGSLFVADTWDHQVEKFDADGNYVTSWGVFSNVADLDAMYGPRDIVIDNEGNLLVTDTGNKRVTVFTQDGLGLNTFGTYGVLAGEFDEPVGMTYDAAHNTLFVADAWNQRVQSFLATNFNGGYAPLYQWNVNAWYGQNLENKPYLAMAPDERVLVADPMFGTITVFELDGTYVATLEDGNKGLGMASGLAVTDDGLLLVSDGINNVIHVYEYPELKTMAPEIDATDTSEIFETLSEE